MDQDKSPGHGAGFTPSSGRYSSYSPSGSGNFTLKSEPSSSSFPPPVPGASSESGHLGHAMSIDSNTFTYDISKMPDNPPRNIGHRRAHSEILTLPDDIGFDSDLGVVGAGDGPSYSDDTEADILSMYLDMDKLNSSSATSAIQLGRYFPCSASAASGSMIALSLQRASSEMENLKIGTQDRPRVRHQHSQSMDGSTTIKPEMLVSGSEEMSAGDSKKAISANKLAELALIDPKRAKRIWANRQSAARSKERKMRYIAELERKVQTLQTDATSLSAQLTLLQRDTNGLNAENSELKLRLQSMEQQVHLQDALNDALKEEIHHLKILTGQAMTNGAPVMNFGASLGSRQQFYPNSQAMHAMLATQQLQQLQIHSQQFQQEQLQQLQQQKMHAQQEQQHHTGDLKNRVSTSSPSLKENASADMNTSSTNGA